MADNKDKKLEAEKSLQLKLTTQLNQSLEKSNDFYKDSNKSLGSLNKKISKFNDNIANVNILLGPSKLPKSLDDLNNKVKTFSKSFDARSIPNKLNRFSKNITNLNSLLEKDVFNSFNSVSKKTKVKSKENVQEKTFSGDLKTKGKGWQEGDPGLNTIFNEGIKGLLGSRKDMVPLNTYYESLFQDEQNQIGGKGKGLVSMNTRYEPLFDQVSNKQGQIGGKGKGLVPLDVYYEAFEDSYSEETDSKKRKSKKSKATTVSVKTMNVKVMNVKTMDVKTTNVKVMNVKKAAYGNAVFKSAIFKGVKGLGGNGRDESGRRKTQVGEKDQLLLPPPKGEESDERSKVWATVKAAAATIGEQILSDTVEGDIINASKRMFAKFKERRSKYSGEEKSDLIRTDDDLEKKRDVKRNTTLTTIAKLLKDRSGGGGGGGLLSKLSSLLPMLASIGSVIGPAIIAALPALATGMALALAGTVGFAIGTAINQTMDKYFPDSQKVFESIGSFFSSDVEDALESRDATAKELRKNLVSVLGEKSVLLSEKSDELREQAQSKRKTIGGFLGDEMAAKVLEVEASKISRQAAEAGAAYRKSTRIEKAITTPTVRIEKAITTPTVETIQRVDIEKTNNDKENQEKTTEFLLTTFIDTLVGKMSDASQGNEGQLPSNLLHTNVSG
jgi:hypothetical protein